jgi:hypothetical protein
MLQVCLDALHNILKQTAVEHLADVTTEIEECGGMNRNENCFFRNYYLLKI